MKTLPITHVSAGSITMMIQQWEAAIATSKINKNNAVNRLSNLTPNIEYFLLGMSTGTSHRYLHIKSNSSFSFDGAIEHTPLFLADAGRALIGSLYGINTDEIFFTNAKTEIARILERHEQEILDIGELLGQLKYQLEQIKQATMDRGISFNSLVHDETKKLAVAMSKNAAIKNMNVVINGDLTGNTL